MNALNNLKTNVKLLGSFGIILVVLIAIAVVGYMGMNTINNGMTLMYFDRTIPIQQLGSVKSDLYTIRGDVFKGLLVPAEMVKSEASIPALETNIDKNINTYKSTQLSDAEAAEIPVFDAAWKEYKAAVADVLAMNKAGNQKDALTSIADGGRASNARKAVSASAEKLLGINVTIAGDLNTQGNATFASSRYLLIGFALLAAVLAIVFGMVITNSIAIPLGAVTRMALALSGGDLLRDMSEAEKDKIRLRKDEIGIIGQAFDGLTNYMQSMGAAAETIADNDLTVTVMPKSANDELGNAFVKMIAGLQSVIGQLTDNANSLGSASEQLATAASQAGQATTQISKTVQQVAQGTNQQSEATARTAKAMEQMSRAIDGVAQGAQEQSKAASTTSQLTNQISEAVRQVAGNADAVTRDSGNAAKAAREGSKTVEATIEGMRNIKAKVGLSAQKVQEMGQRSDQIGMIVETIDDIASQTNLLALNAAIEAARAGEHGKGFAVVADEVRKLAERSSSATKEINGLIRGIQKTVAEAVQAMSEGAAEVESGVVLANEAGQSLNNILDAAEAVFSQADQAAKAAARMGALADQMVASADTVSSIIEENTASTEQMSANSAEVVQAIENIAAVSEENSASAEEVSASTEEMSAQVEEVTASAQDLSETAQELKKMVALFRLPESQTRRSGNGSSPAKKSAIESGTWGNGTGKNGHKTTALVSVSTKHSFH